MHVVRLMLRTLALTLPALAEAQLPPGACVLDDALFTTQLGGCQDLSSGLVWSATQPGSFTWSYANQTWVPNLVEAGYSDWRMPTFQELVDAHAHGAASHLQVTCLPCAYWSSTPKGNKAWGIRFDTGATALRTKGSALLVLAVRSTGLEAATTDPALVPPFAAAPDQDETVTHFLSDSAHTVDLRLPRHAGASFVAFLSLPAPHAGAPRPLTFLEVGRLNAEEGHHTLRLEPGPCVPAYTLLASSTLILLVLDSTGTTVHRIPL